MNHSSQPADAVVIPDHQLVKRIGQGAYGEIWLARNVIGTYRAVKIVHRSQFDNPKPFEREFTGLQAFEPVSRSHPGLVDILQVGRNDDAGYLYYVMELADDQIVGNRVDPDAYSAKTLGREIARRERLPANEALRVGLRLAAALAHLHKAGLVHRDIKPSNIIFVEGEPKLADIGLVVSLANARTFVGSEGYIPPEGPGSIQADIYSLGKVLYEISTGQDKEQFPELPKDITSWEDCGGVLELNEVVVKACANKPQSRYATADELHGDLEMIFAGRSVKRLHFVERQLARVTRIAAVAIGLAILAAVLAYAVNRVRNREKELLAAAYIANGVNLVADGNPHAAVPMFGAALRLQKKDPALAEATRVRIGTALQQSPRLLQFWEGSAAVDDLRFSPDGRRLLVAAKRYVRLLDLATAATNAEFKIAHRIYGAAFSPDGSRIAVANGNSLTMIDAATGTNVFHAERHSLVLSVEFSPDGKTLLLGRAGRSPSLIDAADGQPITLEFVGHSNEVTYAAWSSDGTRIVTASRDGTARLWDAQTHQSLAVMPHAEWVQDVAISPDGRRVVTASSDHTLFVWDISREPRIICRLEHRGAVQRVRFSPDGYCIASAGMDQTVRLWNPNTGRQMMPTINLHMPALTIAFAPDGRRLAVAGQSGHVQVWDAFADAPLNVGNGIASAGGDRYVTYTSNSFQIWNASNDAAITPSVTVSQHITSISCSADGRTVALVGKSLERSGLVSIYTAETGLRQLDSISASKTVLLSPDGTKLFTSDGTMGSVWNIATGTMLFTSNKFPAGVRAAAFSPDSQTLALGCDKTLLVLDAKTGATRFESRQNAIRISKLVFTSDSSRLVSTTADSGYDPGTASVWNVRTGERLAECALHTDGVIAASITADGQSVATGGEDSNALIWNAATGRQRIERLTLRWKIKSVAFSADDRWLLGSSHYETQLWEARTGHALTPVFWLPGPGLIFDSGLCADQLRIWVRTSRGLLFWKLPRVEGDPDEIVALADRLGVTVPSGIPWNSAALPLSQLRDRCAADRARVESTFAAWHEQQSRVCERDENWFAVQFHVERLLQSAPTNGELLARLEFARSRLAAPVPAQSPPNP